MSKEGKSTGAAEHILYVNIYKGILCNLSCFVEKYHIIGIFLSEYFKAEILDSCLWIYRK